MNESLNPSMSSFFPRVHRRSHGLGLARRHPIPTPGPAWNSPVPGEPVRGRTRLATTSSAVEIRHSASNLSRDISLGKHEAPRASSTNSATPFGLSARLNLLPALRRPASLPCETRLLPKGVFESCSVSAENKTPPVARSFITLSLAPPLVSVAIHLFQFRRRLPVPLVSPRKGLPVPERGPFEVFMRFIRNSLFSFFSCPEKEKQ
uniref:Uncharacterized protein n=1 Tax=Steinernema glaseri TaxID=37863 RepID=A0A1I7Y7M8_9BILA